MWVAFVVAYQRDENDVVQPLVYGRALKGQPARHDPLRPRRLLVVGFLGALLALPVAAVIQIVLRDWWASRGEDSPATGHPSP